MRIAIPLIDGQFGSHFGQSNGLYLAELDPVTGRVDQPRQVARQVSGCESMPQWLHDMKVELVLAGGIGMGARQHLAGFGIQVHAGLQGQTPEQVIADYLANPQAQRPNLCGEHDHGHEHHHCRH